MCVRHARGENALEEVELTALAFREVDAQDVLLLRVRCMFVHYGRIWRGLV